MLHLTLEKFLSDNEIADDEWAKSGLDWKDLLAIGQDHMQQRPDLERDAEYFAQTLQRFNKVHSVRWRVKDAEHLMAKIVRKRLEANPKYASISVANYSDIIDDLIGLRALHLFKSDCFVIDERVRKDFGLAETPIAYVREGDDVVIRDRFHNGNFVVKNHKKGYRSVHYIVATQLGIRKVKAELQVRTIIEEAWSEIDHTIRYPNFSDDPSVAALLTVFNRIAGSADELGEFALALKDALENEAAASKAVVEEARAAEAQARSAESQARAAEKQARAERDSTYAKLDDALKQLEKSKNAQAMKAQLNAVKQEVKKLKNDEERVRAVLFEPITSASSLTATGHLRIGGLADQMETARANLGLSALAAQQQVAGHLIGTGLEIDKLGYVKPLSTQVAGPLSVQFSATQQATSVGSLWTANNQPVASPIGTLLSDHVAGELKPLGTQAWTLQQQVAMDAVRSASVAQQLSTNYLTPGISSVDVTAQRIGTQIDALSAVNSLKTASAALDANKLTVQQQAVGSITSAMSAFDEATKLRRTLDIASGKLIK